MNSIEVVKVLDEVDEEFSKVLRECTRPAKCEHHFGNLGKKLDKLRQALAATASLEQLDLSPKKALEEAKYEADKRNDIFTQGRQSLIEKMNQLLETLELAEKKYLIFGDLEIGNRYRKLKEFVKSI